jgi:hypothetical protein
MFFKKDATSLELERLRGVLNGDNPIEEKVEETTKTEEAKSEEKTETAEPEKKIEEASNDKSKNTETKVEEKIEDEEEKSSTKVEVDESAVMAYLKSKNIQVDSIDDLNKKISQKSKEEQRSLCFY